MRIDADSLQYDWPLFAKLTGFTEGSLKKFWPPVKNKAIEQTESFGAFLNGASVGAAVAAPKAATAGGKKRKAADADADADLDPKTSSTNAFDDKPAGGKAKKASAKKRGKKAKAEDNMVKEEENSADGGDGLGEFVYRKDVVDWLESTDSTADEV